MRVVQVKEPNAPFELVERPMPEPGPREARIKVEACGICHSDVFVATGTFPGIRYPAVPGHEIAGRIEQDRLRRHHLARRAAGRRRLVRRRLLRLRPLPPRRFHHLPQSPHTRHPL